MTAGLSLALSWFDTKEIIAFANLQSQSNFQTNMFFSAEEGIRSDFDSTSYLDVEIKRLIKKYKNSKIKVLLKISIELAC